MQDGAASFDLSGRSPRGKSWGVLEWLGFAISSLFAGLSGDGFALLFRSRQVAFHVQEPKAGRANSAPVEPSRRAAGLTAVSAAAHRSVLLSRLVERAGFEPATPCLQSTRSPAELPPHAFCGAHSCDQDTAATVSAEPAMNPANAATVSHLSLTISNLPAARNVFSM